MPRVALLPHTRDWTYDFTAQALVRHLSHRFDLSVFYADTMESFDYRDFDLLVDFWWKGQQSKRFGERVVVQVSSHRWARDKYGRLDAAELVNGHLRKAGALLVPSVRLRDELSPHFARDVALCPKGFHPEAFGDVGARRGGLVVGWAGNASAGDKNVALLVEACPDLRIATDLDYEREMPGWYNGIDVITCASDAEGDPRTLIEGMACGCFPITVDVGIVPELVRHGENGLIVERTAAAFEDAIAWCRRNVDYVREAGKRNAEQMLATRTWARVAPAWGDAIQAAIDRAPDWRTDARMERKMRIRARLARLRAERAAAAE
jgi:hypothetical protein